MPKVGTWTWVSAFSAISMAACVKGPRGGPLEFEACSLWLLVTAY
jgi:hypothetical protein